ncbi:MAG: DUF1573 domain-containing protein [Bacteroidales bacterium]|nr:DUF1573 domain-containing protein [Bacteroidales bacterium]
MKNFVVLFLLLLPLMACQRPKEPQNDALAILKEHRGKTFAGNSDLDSITTSAPYTIIYYIDAKGCIPCKLRLNKWARLVEELRYFAGFKDSQIVFLVHENANKEIKRIFKSEDFDLGTIVVDSGNHCLENNKIPQDILYQTFLVDSTGVITVIGNPLESPDIHDLYIKKICPDSLSFISYPHASVSFPTSTKNLGELRFGEVIKDSLVLKNQGVNPLYIRDIVPSCECMQVEYTSSPIESGDSVVIRFVLNIDNYGEYTRELKIFANTSPSLFVFEIEGIVNN